MKEKILKKVISNKIARNAGWIIAERIMQMTISLIVGLVTTRYLGPNNYGVINYANTYTGFFFALSSLGINSILVKELIDNPNEEGMVIGTSLGLKFIASLCSYISIISIVSIIDADDPVAIAVTSLSSISVVCNIFETLIYWFQSKLNSKATVLCTIIAYIATSIYKVFLVITGKKVVYFALALSLDYLVRGILLYVSYKCNNGQKLRFSLKYGKKLLSKSYHFILSSLMTAIYSQTDKFMIKHMRNVTETGYYSTSVILCNMWCFILVAIIDSMRPSIMKSFDISKDKFDKKNKELYAIIFYLSMFVSIIFTIFAKPIIYILYGEEFMGAVKPLRIVTWYISFSYLGIARNIWLICYNKQKYLIYIFSVAAMLNVVLNAVLIPICGATGAAYATVITQILTIIGPFFVHELRENTLLIIDAIFLRGIINRKNKDDNMIEN